jgi:uncharacterized protein YbbC (DUF1343 family)
MRFVLGLILLLGVVLVPGCVTDPRAPRVRLGNEVLADSGFQALQGKRVGLITNPSGVDGHLQSTVELLRSAPGVTLAALFGPEHGIYGDVPAGVRVEGSMDARTGVPAYSLYGETKRPTPAMLRGLDALVYDLQDTGCRSYTFINTMGDAMDACGEAGIEFVVLDRPNPLGGLRVEGPMLRDEFQSGVGRWTIPYVYGLTCGELARMINDRGWIKHPCRLTVVPLHGWRRDMTWEDTGLPWVPTSPHVPHARSPLFQVATGMLGETGVVSVGVGYTLPFQCLAAPGIDGPRLAEILRGFRVPGVAFRPITYQPSYATFKGELIGGVEIYFTDPLRAPLAALNYYGLAALRQMGVDVVARTAAADPTRIAMFDKVNGTDAPRKEFSAGKSAAEIVAGWKADESAFRREREKYLLY